MVLKPAALRAIFSAVRCAFLGSLAIAIPRPSIACGLTPPIGPNGLPTVCRGDDAHIIVRVGLVGGGTSTKIDFGSESAKLLQGATSATIDLLPLERLSLSAALGATLPGRLDYAGTRFDLLPGPMAGVGIGYRLFGGKAPFIHTSLTLSLARSTTRAPDGREEAFTSRDYRLGVAVGKTLGKVAAPFAFARYFGGGTSWAVAGHGGDHFRYQVGIGSAFTLSEHFDALAELAFLGERRMSLGIGYVF